MRIKKVSTQQLMLLLAAAAPGGAQASLWPKSMTAPLTRGGYIRIGFRRPLRNTHHRLVMIYEITDKGRELALKLRPETAKPKEGKHVDDPLRPNEGNREAQ